MARLFDTDEQHSLHHRYKQGDLFRQWAPILAMLARKNGEMDATAIWFLAERQVTRLREETAYREQEIPPMFNELVADCRTLVGTGARTVERSGAEALRSAVTVMCVVLTMLMNSVEKGHEEEGFGNEPICMAIMDILAQDAYFQQLMKLFFSRRTGYDGREVVITPSDPMTHNDPTANMDETAREETARTRRTVLTLTEGLKVHFDKGERKGWDRWESVWNDICTDTELMSLLKEKNPRTSDWDVNEKMVCNVLGMFLEIMDYRNSVSIANGLLQPPKNRRDYISSHDSNGGSSAVLSKGLHQRVEAIIRSKQAG
jgi:hypothetical protein